MVKFPYNNTVSATTGITTFFALHEEHQYWIIKQNPVSKTPILAILKEWANQLENWNNNLKSEMVYAWQFKPNKQTETAYLSLHSKSKKKCGSSADIPRPYTPHPSWTSKGWDNLRLLNRYVVMPISWTSSLPWNTTQFFKYFYLNP